MTASLEDYTDHELHQELARRGRGHVAPIEFGPMGAWRSFHGNLVFDVSDERARYRGMLLPELNVETMGFQSVGDARRAAIASGWSEVQESCWVVQ